MGQGSIPQSLLEGHVHNHAPGSKRLALAKLARCSAGVWGRHKSYRACIRCAHTTTHLVALLQGFRGVAQNSRPCHNKVPCSAGAKLQDGGQAIDLGLRVRTEACCV
eukprot:1154881-Pelagomonas_calceolata.AAC.3